MKMRRFAVSVLAAGVLVGVAGCSGNDSTSDSATEPTTDATTGATTATPTEATSDATTGATTDAPTEATSDATTGNPSTGPASASLTKENFAAEVTAAQTNAKSAHVEATIEAEGQSFVTSGDLTGFGKPADLEMQLVATFGGQSIELRALDQTIYVKNPQPTADGKEWLKIGASDSNNPLAQVFDSANPGNFTAYLEGITKFEDKGTETIEGVETRHYSITVDTAQMLKANPMFQGQDASALGLPPELTSETYIDGENRPVRLHVELGSTGSFEATFTDYGKDVSVEAPDPSTVGEFSL